MVSVAAIDLLEGVRVDAILGDEVLNPELSLPDLIVLLIEELELDNVVFTTGCRDDDVNKRLLVGSLVSTVVEVVSETPIVGSELIIDDVDSSTVEDEETISELLLYAVGIDAVEDTDVGTVVLTELFSTELCVIGVVVGISVDLNFSVAEIIIVSSAEEADSETTVLSLTELVIELEETDFVSFVFEEDT